MSGRNHHDTYGWNNDKFGRKHYDMSGWVIELSLGHDGVVMQASFGRGGFDEKHWLKYDRDYL